MPLLDDHSSPNCLVGVVSAPSYFTERSRRYSRHRAHPPCRRYRRSKKFPVKCGRLLSRKADETPTSSLQVLVVVRIHFVLVVLAHRPYPDTPFLPCNSSWSLSCVFIVDYSYAARKWAGWHILGTHEWSCFPNTRLLCCLVNWPELLLSARLPACIFVC